MRAVHGAGKCPAVALKAFETRSIYQPEKVARPMYRNCFIERNTNVR